MEIFENKAERSRIFKELEDKAERSMICKVYFWNLRFDSWKQGGMPEHFQIVFL